jgi:hypothetical protein
MIAAMARFASSRFRQATRALPENGRFWTARVGEDYRALGIGAEEGVLRIWIGRIRNMNGSIRS